MLLGLLIILLGIICFVMWCCLRMASIADNDNFKDNNIKK